MYIFKIKETNVLDNENLLKILPCYYILIEKPKLKRLFNVKLLNELPFYHSLNIKEVPKSFIKYAKSFSIEIVYSKDPLIQLNAIKSSIKDLLKTLDLLYEMKGFKYQITMNILLSKSKINGDTECNSTEHSSV